MTDEIVVQLCPATAQAYIKLEMVCLIWHCIERSLLVVWRINSGIKLFNSWFSLFTLGYAKEQQHKA